MKFRFSTAGVAMAAVGTAAFAEGMPSTSAPAWNLTQVFANKQAATTEMSAIEVALPKLGALQGQLSGPDATLAALDLRSALRGRATRLSVYASMRLSRDQSDQEASADATSAAALFAKLNAASAYIEPELVALGPSRLSALAADPRLARHRFTLEQLATRSAHVLPADQEALVAGVTPLQTAPATIRDIFTNVELPWPTIDVHGQPRRLNVQGFGKTLRDPDRDTRRRAWESFSATRTAFQQTQAALLSTFLGGEGWEAKLRRWPSQVDFITSSDPMPVGAFPALSAEAEVAARGPMARYVALKAHALGLSSLTSYDVAAPFVADTRSFTIEEAKQLTLDAVAPLGREYQDRLTRGLASNLMDWQPQRTKGSGANTFYVAADIPGYVELSFAGDYGGVSAMAHEWGHWMHWDYVRTSGRPYETLFPPISVGDAPSFLNELLLADSQIASAKTREARIVALTSAIELLRSTYYGVVAEASFDISLRNASDRGDVLDADHVSEIYCSARKRFSPPGIAWDPRDCLGWVTEPYVFYDMYFYRYLLATSAAAWFAERVEAGDKVAITRFKNFLATGGSADATTLLRSAGFDPAVPSSYAAMTRRLDRLVKMLDVELTKERK